MAEPIATSNIAAQAFRLMELMPISSFADDTPQATDAAEQYQVVLRQNLEACDWSFASVLAHLPPAELTDTQAVDVDFPYSYALPGDCVRLIEVRDADIRWRRDLDLLRADTDGPLTIRYTAMIQNEAKLPAAFQIAVAYRLAAALAPRWVGAQTKVNALISEAERALIMAMKQDARQASPARYDGRAEQPDWLSEVLS